MGFIKRYLFFVGIILLAHAFYMAYSFRHELKAHHHSTGVIPMASFGGSDVSVTAVRVPIVIEVLAGMIITMIGFVQRKTLRPARLCDATRHLRYDHQMNTGVGFIHFNHRGTLAATKAKEKSAAEKKQE